MAQEKPNRWVEWLLLIRERAPEIRTRFNEWFYSCREEPRLIWQTPPVRYAVFGLSGLIVIWIVVGLVETFAPAPPAAAQPEATTAVYHVLCTSPDCGEHFAIERHFGFRDFPVECPKCGRKTGERAFKCNSQTCQGRWVIPVMVDDQPTCPICGRPL